MNRNSGQQHNRQPEREQFTAYGQYSYEYQHTSQQRQPGVQQPVAAQADTRKKTPLTPAEKQKKRDQIFYRLFAIVALALIGIVVVLQVTFRLREVEVLNVSNEQAQYIAAASGLTRGQNIFDIKAEDVAKSIQRDYSLVFQDLRIDLPDKVILDVEIRKEVTLLEWLGVNYTLDKEGMVMQYNCDPALKAVMPEVNGFDMRSIRQGTKLEPLKSSQLTAYQILIGELLKQDYLDEVSEINLDDPQEITLQTKDGISVRLGDSTDIRHKVQAIRTCLGYLRGLGETSGLLDVTVPERSKYRSEN